MKKISIILLMLLGIGCVPSKSDRHVTVSITCDSCYVVLSSFWYKGDDYGAHLEYEGMITGTKITDILRFDCEPECVKLTKFYNYKPSDTTIRVFYIENGDTTVRENYPTGFCY